MVDKKLIEGCKNEDRVSQKLLYDLLSPKMLAVCRRYLRNVEEAEDALVNGMYKMFKNIHQFEGKGSFEGWVKRIVVNEALMILRKQKDIVELEYVKHKPTDEITAIEKLQFKDVLRILEQLPRGYRTVFNQS